MQRTVSLSIVVALAAATAPLTAQRADRTRMTAAVAPGQSLPSTLGPRLLPGTRGNVYTTIQGNALSSVNAKLADTLVRLRDARYGRIVGTETTDKSGLFEFHTVDPGSYVVELLGVDRATVLAASQILDVAAGEVISAVVKLPFRIPPYAGVLGHTVGQAATVTSAAAASGVLATTITGEATSPDQ